MSSSPLTRRAFLKNAGLASASALAFPAILRSQDASVPAAPNNRLNVACVGVGGRARRGAVDGLMGENFVAFADVDDDRAAETFNRFPNVPRFRDYRQMFDKLGNQIDAVAITTPDHMHFPIAMAALALGKHVFCEKPLVHTVEEARVLAKTAREKKVITQMGNQGHAGEGIRMLKEWIQAGVLGEVREVHSWTDRPGKVWPQGRFSVADLVKNPPTGTPPTSLDWDLWLGIAQPRPYAPVYAPTKWRGYWDFGTGAMGDMGCHLLDGAHWALELDAPTHVEAIHAGDNQTTGCSSSIVTYRFPARGALAPVTLKWYDGGLAPVPPLDLETTRNLPENGTLFVGTKATVLATLYYQSIRIIPEIKMQEMLPSLPAKTIPRVEGGHFAEWIRGCKGGPMPGSNFEVASRLTELCLLSNVAIRAGRGIEWDAKAMQITNLPEANQYLRKTYRLGFGV